MLQALNALIKASHSFLFLDRKSNQLFIYQNFPYFFRCRFVQFLIYALAMVSIYTLVLMSLDRFLAVVYAVESMTWRTEANCKVAIAIGKKSFFNGYPNSTEFRDRRDFAQRDFVSKLTLSEGILLSKGL